jgi:hypothetical protein
MMRQASIALARRRVAANSISNSRITAVKSVTAIQHRWNSSSSSSKRGLATAASDQVKPPATHDGECGYVLSCSTWSAGVQ